jgi:hypothetical protein
LTPVGVHDADEVERGITEFAQGSDGGLIVVGPPSSIRFHRDPGSGLSMTFQEGLHDAPAATESDPLPKFYLINMALRKLTQNADLLSG